MTSRSDPVSPAVSVILPTCNRPNLLGRALKSVAGQTCRDFEVIVVNDGGEDIQYVIDSFDGAICIRVINIPTNHGVAHARNTALAQSRGRFIAYLDDDDHWYPEHLERLLAAAEKSGSMVVYSDAFRVRERTTTQGFQPEERRLFSHEFDRDTLMIHNYIPIISLMHRRECTDRTGGFDETLPSHEDWDLLLRMSRGYDFYHLPIVTAEFTLRDDSMQRTTETLRRYGETLEQVYRKTGHLVADRSDLINRRMEYYSVMAHFHENGGASDADSQRAIELIQKVSAHIESGNLREALLVYTLDRPGISAPELTELDMKIDQLRRIATSSSRIDPKSDGAL